jgi:phosphoribosyl 1,2-cyclic phosphodiesterase
MRLSVLASGSGGNAVVVETGEVCVLVDCGISYRQLRARMQPLGIEPEQIQAVLLTHEHDDHVKGLDVFLRHHPVQVMATAGTVGAMATPPAEVETLRAGRELRLGDLKVLPVPTSHDAHEPVGFVVEARGCRAGLVTDTGVFTELLVDRLTGCHALLLECNHDRDLLRYGPYPWPLKQRIAARTGHLSNEQACAALERLAHSGLETVVGMHLSQTNNRPEMVMQELERILAGGGVGLTVANQHKAVRVEVIGPTPRRGQLELFAEHGRVP